MRIIAGKYKGRKIEMPKELGAEVRPTSDFAREAVFNILQHGKFFGTSGCIAEREVLDLFCGTGALGLEALSRGARHVTFVDSSRASVAAARRNAEKMGESQNVDFIQLDASKLGRSRRSYNLVFIDPPYFKGLVLPSIQCLCNGGWLGEGAVVVIEHDNKEAFEMPEMLAAQFVLVDSRRYGRASIDVLSFVGYSA